MKYEEFIADFCLVSRRELNEQQYALFKFHFLLGADWTLCCRKLNMDRGEFFHEVYRIQQQLGRTFAELTPFPLWPIEDYFSSNRHHKQRADFFTEPHAKKAMEFPIRRQEKALAAA